MNIIAESDRIYLRVTSVEDAEFFFILNSNPEVIKYTGDVAFESIESSREFLSNYDQFRKYNMGRWAVASKESSQIIGWCGLKFHPDENFVDLGFRFFQEYWGNGFATEASRLSLEYGFKVLGLKRIVGRADIRNGASIRVLEKVGMIEIGRDEEHGAEIILMEVDSVNFSL